MNKSPIFNFIASCITERIYEKARKLEKDLSPDNFTAYYPYLSSICFFLMFLLLFLSTIISINLSADKFILKLLVLSTLISFVLILYQISYRCFVDETGLMLMIFWFYKKQILWEDIVKVEIYEFTTPSTRYEKHIVMRNKRNKIIYDCSYNLVGFKLIERQIKKRNIKIYRK